MTTQVVLTAVLGARFGITGVAVAILVSVVCVELAITLPLLGKRLGTGTRQLVAPVLRAHLPSLAISGTVGWFVAQGPVLRFVNSHGRLEGTSVVVATGAAIVLLYALLLVVLGLGRTERRGAISWLRNARRAARRTGGAETGLVDSSRPPAGDVAAVDRGNDPEP